MNRGTPRHPSRTGAAATRLRRALGWALATILAFAALFPLAYALAVPEPRGAAIPLALPPAGAYRVFVVDWGYHTAIIAEQPSGWALGPPGEERARFLEYAWGDRRFYLGSQYNPVSVFATLALPTASVLYLAGRSDPPPLGGARAAFVRTVDPVTLHVLLVELERSIRHTAGGSRVPAYPPAAGHAGRFYPAFGPYLWTRNCNWWTVVRLAAAGLAERPDGVVFSWQVGSRLRGFSPAPAR
jgi:uncharacterized protein DUF2459